MRQKILLCFLQLVLIVLPLKVMSATLKIKELSILTVDSAITPATFDYLKQHFENLPISSLIVLKLNTPGGLISVTKDIISMIGTTKRPFIVWINPEGASASSAGAIIASAAHFIFMTPGSSIGAATPVGLNGDIKEGDGRAKALNDLAALVRSLSDLRGRPSLPFEKMITTAQSYTDSEALKLGIINGIITDQKEIALFANNKTITLGGVDTLLEVSDVAVTTYKPTLGQKILEIIANPSTAYLLFLVGIALIYLELQAPGGFILGPIGICFLILAGISFQVLPLNWGALVLILAGVFLLVLEVYIVSYGILSVTGLISFISGSLFLFHGKTGYIHTEYTVMLSTLAGVIFSLSIILWSIVKEKRKPIQVNNFFLPEKAEGVILTKLNPNLYQVKIQGEIWNATSTESLEINEIITVISIDSNKLTVTVQRKI